MELSPVIVEPYTVYLLSCAVEWFSQCRGIDGWRWLYRKILPGSSGDEHVGSFRRSVRLRAIWSTGDGSFWMATIGGIRAATADQPSLPLSLQLNLLGKPPFRKTCQTSFPWWESPEWYRPGFRSSAAQTAVMRPSRPSPCTRRSQGATIAEMFIGFARWCRCSKKCAAMQSQHFIVLNNQVYTTAVMRIEGWRGWERTIVHV